MKPACFFLFVHRHLEKWRSTLSSSASSEAVERGKLRERREGWEGKKKGSRDLSSLPIVHRALIYIFVIFILLEYPGGASKEERGLDKLKFIIHLVILTSYRWTEILLTICMVNTLLVFVEFNRPNMVCTPFITLSANIGICSQRYLELLSHYMFSNKKLRALALIINAAPL